MWLQKHITFYSSSLKAIQNLTCKGKAKKYCPQKKMRQRRTFPLKEDIDIISVFTDYLAPTIQMLGNPIHWVNHSSADVY